MFKVYYFHYYHFILRISAIFCAGHTVPVMFIQHQCCHWMPLITPRKWLSGRETDWYPWPCTHVHRRHRLANGLGSDESVGCVEDPPGYGTKTYQDRRPLHWLVRKNEKILFIAERMQHMHYLRNICMQLHKMWRKLVQEPLRVQFSMPSDLIYCEKNTSNHHKWS